MLLAGAAELAWEPLLADPAGLLRRPQGRPGSGLLAGLLDARLSGLQDTMGA